MEDNATNSQTDPVPAVVRTSEKEGKFFSSKYKKILLVISVLALLVILGELGYFLFSRYKESYTKPGPPGLQEKPIIPEGAQPSRRTLELQQVPKEVALPKAQRFVKLLEEIRGKSEFLDNAIVNIIVSGIVEDVGPEAIEEDGVVYHYKLTLKSNRNNLHTFRFTNEEVEKATLFLLTNQGSQSANFSDIVKNDSIVLDISANLKDQSPNQILVRILRK